MLLSQHRTVPRICRELGFGEQTHYRWRRRYGGLDVNHARRLKELERQNAHLKRLVGEQVLLLAEGWRVNRERVQPIGVLVVDACDSTGSNCWVSTPTRW